MRFANKVLYLVLAISIFLLLPDRTQGSDKIDYTYPDAFDESLWIDVPLMNNAVTIVSMQVLVAKREWSMYICQDRSDFPNSCILSVPTDAGDGGHWSGDFVARDLNIAYNDLEVSKKLHLRVNSENGYWMTFRILIELE